MNLSGRRIHLVGSADPEADEAKLAYAHRLVSALTSALLNEGANFVLPFGKEPLLKDRTDGPSIIFDWTVTQEVHRALLAGTVQPSGPNGRLIASIATSKTDTHIPATRQTIYRELRDRSAMSMEFIERGWSAGAIVRPRLAQLGDIFIGISGGQGLEQLAVEYSVKGKPVIPLDIDVGSSSRDGSGGAPRLFDRARVDHAEFFRVGAGDDAADLLDRTRTQSGTAPVDDVVKAVLRLLHALQPPQVFYVRLLNANILEYPSVEQFFRGTVDPLVRQLGYEPLQMGLGHNEFAWMNQAIFDSLHHSSVVLVDLTGQRPNCFMELGYAFGNGQRVIVTARNDTRIAFDASPIEAFMWDEHADPANQIALLQTHWERNIGMPSLVIPRTAK